MDKLGAKLLEEKEEMAAHQQRYLGSLVSFNNFAQAYNTYLSFHTV